MKAKKLKINSLNYHHWEYNFDSDSYIFPCAIPLSKSKNPTVSLIVTIRELKEGKISLDTLNAKLKNLMLSFKYLLTEGDKKDRKRFIKQLQKSLKS